MKTKASDLLNERFTKSASDPLVKTLGNHTISYSSFWANAEKMAQDWVSLGAKKGDVVALIQPNQPGLLCAYLACAIGGFVACPILDTNHQDTKKKILKLVRPRLIVERAFQLDAKLEHKGPFKVKTQDADRFLIVFSSGSTGEPKAICHSLTSIIGSAASFARLTEMNKETVLYHILPMAYMAGIMNCFFAPLMAGGSIVEGQLYSPMFMSEFWDRPLSNGVNTISLVPTIAAALCRLTKSKDSIEKVRKQIKQVQSTSAPLTKKMHKDFYELFQIPLQNCYGMTEFGGPLTFQTRQDALALAEGSLPIPELEISIRTDKQELWIKTPFLMQGYLQEDGSLEVTVDEEGFMNTGDTAMYANGKIHLTGRTKDIVIRGGINVSPTRIESVLSMAAGVQEVSVVGVDHPFWGESIVACVVAKPGVVDVIESVNLHAREHLANHEWPDKIVPMKELPRSFIGKVQKAVLAETLKAS